MSNFMQRRIASLENKAAPNIEDKVTRIYLVPVLPDKTKGEPVLLWTHPDYQSQSLENEAQ